MDQSEVVPGAGVGQNENTLNLKIEGMDCPDCAARLERRLGGLPEVSTARIDFLNRRAKVEYRGVAQDKTVVDAINELGYRARPVEAALASDLEVGGICCGDEAAIIEKLLLSISGVDSVTINLATGQVRVVHDCSIELIIGALGGAGFPARLMEATPAAGVNQKSPRDEARRHMLLAATIASGVFLAAAEIILQLGMPYRAAIILFSLAMAAGGWHIARRALLSLRVFSLDMNVLMSLAVAGAAVIGQWSEGAMVVFLFSLAQYLESMSLARARRAIGSLMDMSPKTARVQRPDGEFLLLVAQVRVGDLIVVRPGEKIPVDGNVQNGVSTVNQAPITGESAAVPRAAGDRVYAGSVNGEGALEILADRPADDTTLARIVHLVEESQSLRAPAQRFVDRFARVYTPVVVTGAFLVAILPPLVLGAPFFTWFYRALVMLVIACPCALVISTPVTIISALAGAARAGILIKGGAALEELGRARAIALDKTGTLTEGRARVLEVVAADSRSQAEIITLAAAVESRSEHHLGQAIRERARVLDLAATPGSQFKALAGRGAQALVENQIHYLGSRRWFEELGHDPSRLETLSGQFDHSGHTLVYLGTRHELLGMLVLTDALRKGAGEAVTRLHRLGVNPVVMLTGDGRDTAGRIGEQAGVDEVHAGLLPEEKVKFIIGLKQKWGTVVMVGDGVNDAPALAAASVGIAMGGVGTDVALETADVALMSDELPLLPRALRLGRQSLGIVKQNVVVAIAVKGIFLILASLGLATLWMAVAADMGVSLLVIANGMRALRIHE